MYLKTQHEIERETRNKFIRLFVWLAVVVILMSGAYLTGLARGMLEIPPPCSATKKTYQTA